MANKTHKCTVFCLISTSGPIPAGPSILNLLWGHPSKYYSPWSGLIASNVSKNQLIFLKIISRDENHSFQVGLVTGMYNNRHV